eukprot:scaffold225749_cov25-Prasinocladus_malaysianus.AAC.1
MFCLKNLFDVVYYATLCEHPVVQHFPAEVCPGKDSFPDNQHEDICRESRRQQRHGKAYGNDCEDKAK